MGENEDYLDSLLKAASVQDDNPDSANNKLREMGFTESAKKNDSVFSDDILLTGEPEPIADLDAGLIVDGLENADEFEGLYNSTVEEVSEVVEAVSENVDNLGEVVESVSENVDNVGEVVESVSDNVDNLSEGIGSMDENVDDVLSNLFETVEKETTTSKASDVNEDFLNSLFEEVSTPKKQEIKGTETNIDLPRGEAPKDLISEVENTPVIEESVTEEAVANETLIEETSVGAPVMEASAVEESISEEPFAEEPLNENIIVEEPIIEEFIVEEPIAEKIVEEEPAVNAEPVVEEQIGEDVDVSNQNEEINDIDSLLQSDFSGEIDIADIDKLLSGAEDFASEAGEESEKTESIGVDSVKNLTQEQIERMLSGAEDIGDGEMEIDMNDMSAIESQLGIFDKNEFKGTGDDAGLDEISDLINAFDNNDAVSAEDADLLSILNAEIDNQGDSEQNESEDEASEETDKNKKEKSKKNKKGKNDKSSKKKKEEKTQKETKLSKFLDFMTASDDEDEESDELLKPSDAPTAETGEFEAVPGENQKILAELDAEGEDNPKGKKKKKKKGKKGKEAPKNSSGDEDGEEGEGQPAKKGKKPKKEKKEKKPLELDIDTGKPLSKKNVRKIFIMCFSFLLLVVLLAKFVPSMLTNATARKAYYSGEYEEAYTSFFGEKLSDSDQILFERSAIIMKLVHKYQFFGYYKEIGMNAEALDQLLQAVENYEPWLMVAELTGATDEFKKEYSKIVSALDAYFGLTEESARDIIALETDLEYSLMVEAVANGTEYIDPNTPLQEPFVPPMDEVEPVYEDMLDEEGY